LNKNAEQFSLLGVLFCIQARALLPANGFTFGKEACGWAIFF
jgi:hypothetical protein